MGNENFKNYGQSYNFETGIIKLVEYDNKDAMYCVYSLDMGEDKHNFRTVANYIDKFNNDINEMNVKER